MADKRDRILIENMDKELWSKFVAIARYRGIKAGEQLNDVISAFIDKYKIKEVRGLSSKKS